MHAGVPPRDASGEVSYLSEILEICNFRCRFTPEFPGSLTGEPQQIRVTANEAQHRSQLRQGHGRSTTNAGCGARDDDCPARQSHGPVPVVETAADCGPDAAVAADDGRL